MLTIKTAAHIRGAKHVKGFRSCLESTGVPLAGTDLDRSRRAEIRLERSEWRRRWLARQWVSHEWRVRSRREG